MPHFDADSKRIALKMLGRAQLIRSDRAGARASLEEALKLDANDAESLLLLGRIARHEQRLDDAKSLLQRAPQSNIVMLERALVARDAGDLAAERAALEALPDRPALRAELAVVNVRQSPNAANLRALHVTTPEVTAVLDALDGKRDAAAKSLAQSASPIARGDAGILFWQLGMLNDAKPHLVFAHKAFADWSEVSLAAAEVAISERRYDDAAELLDRSDATATRGVVARTQRSNSRLEAMPTSAAVQRNRSPIALLAQAADELDRAAKRQDEAAARRARTLAERAASLDERRQSLALFIRGTADLITGARCARRAFASDRRRSPAAIESIAKKNLEAAQPAKEVAEEPTSSQPRHTVVVFLPDTPAETEKKLAEAATAIVGSLAAASSLPLKTELFRRADDARAFIAANRDRIGVIIANPEFIAHDFAPRFAFSRDGQTTYVRKVIVPARSSAKSLADLRGKTISGSEALGDDGVAVTRASPTTSPPPRTRCTAAPTPRSSPNRIRCSPSTRAICASSTPPHRSRCRSSRSRRCPPPIAPRSTTRCARSRARRSRRCSSAASSASTSRASPRSAKSRRSPSSALGLKLDPPIALPLRVSVELPRVEIPEDLFGPP